MAGPQFVIDFEPMYGEMVEVSPLLRRLVCKNPSKFTFHGTGTYVIGRGDVAVVDPGPRDDDHIHALLQALDGEVVRHILITHTHGDHSPAAHALHEATGAPILGFGKHPEGSVGEGDDRDDEDDEAEASSEPREPQIEEDPEFQRKHAPDVDFDPDTTLAHGDIVEGPGYTVEALHTPGHISNHLCFALAEENSVLSGDHVMGWSTTIIPPPDGDASSYLDSLRVLLNRPHDERLYPTHGAPVENHHEFVQALLDHRIAREVGIIGQLRDGPKSAREIVSVLYADVRKELHKPAARSVLSHLRKLHDEAVVELAVTDASTLSSKTVWVLR
ncbi:MAG: MBL fold metallo-hydrolase [Acidimicrobiales bacterium]|nr:MBL fold metallo-hydrolase [Acidimicrobiales bacterium]